MSLCFILVFCCVHVVVLLHMKSNLACRADFGVQPKTATITVKFFIRTD